MSRKRAHRRRARELLNYFTKTGKWLKPKHRAINPKKKGRRVK